MTSKPASGDPWIPDKRYDARAMSPKKKIGLVIGGGLLLIGALVVTNMVCVRAWLRYGITIDECPSGDLVPGVRINAYGLRRGTEGTVEVSALAHYTTDAADGFRVASMSRIDANVELLVGDEARALEPVEGWEDTPSGIATRVVLPKDLQDGDHRLRATVQTPLGEQVLTVPLAVYAPAKIHVITDRPLYEPGNTIHFRATVLRARDLAPLDGRPGRFEVIDPTGTLVLEEKAPAKRFGVASGSLPLDSEAPVGTWTIRWASGTASQEIQVRVAPFELPRFVVEASPSRPYYRPNETPRLSGTVRYSSGAPVSAAAIELSWTTSGPWPPPRDWMEGLPKSTRADSNGRFELELARVPAKLMDQLSLVAHLAARDESGDRVEGAAVLLFSEDGIATEAVTELEGGIVQGFNNRMFLRATTPAGTPLADARLTVKRAWDPTDEGIVAVADADGVAALQLDPGSPVNVVVPPMPIRPPPRPPAVRIQNIEERIAGAYVLADRKVIDGWRDAFERCSYLVSDAEEQLVLGLAVAPDGRIHGVSSGDSPAARCAGDVVRGRSLGRDAERLYRITVALQADLPTLDVVGEGIPELPSPVRSAFDRSALEARRCLPVDGQARLRFPHLLTWKLTGGRLSVAFQDDPSASGARPSASEIACVEARMRGARLDVSKAQLEALARRPHFGFARLSSTPRRSMQSREAAPTTFLGYELRVVATTTDGEAIGETTLRLRPGAVPSFRIRASPTIAKPGERIELSLLRGPGFSGDLPKKLWLRSTDHELEADVDPAKRNAMFTLPADADGWFEASWGGGRALVFVKPEAQLAVKVSPDRPKYRPGESATLAIATTAGDRGVAAAVGLIGVDDSLSQLVALPGPSEMASLRDLPQLGGAAFTGLDAKALAMGRIRGANAIAATVLRVAQIPTAAEIDTYTSATGQTEFDVLGPLTDRFYTILEELHAIARGWERSAPEGALMTPKKMAEMFEQARAAVEARGERVDDAFGRPLRLSRLPSDLLALTDPRAVVIEGTRLPEDVENWQAWVRREQP